MHVFHLNFLTIRVFLDLKPKRQRNSDRQDEISDELTASGTMRRVMSVSRKWPWMRLKSLRCCEKSRRDKFYFEISGSCVSKVMDISVEVFSQCSMTFT